MQLAQDQIHTRAVALRNYILNVSSTGVNLYSDVEVWGMRFFRRLADEDKYMILNETEKQLLNYEESIIDRNVVSACWTASNLEEYLLDEEKLLFNTIHPKS